MVENIISLDRKPKITTKTEKAEDHKTEIEEEDLKAFFLLETLKNLIQQFKTQ